MHLRNEWLNFYYAKEHLLGIHYYHIGIVPLRVYSWRHWNNLWIVFNRFHNFNMIWNASSANVHYECSNNNQCKKSHRARLNCDKRSLFVVIVINCIFIKHLFNIVLILYIYIHTKRIQIISFLNLYSYINYKNIKLQNAFDKASKFLLFTDYNVGTI